MIDEPHQTCSKPETRVTFGWWNTGLSPTGKTRANLQEKTIASEVIRYLAEDLRIDCLAIGEITPDDVADFGQRCDLSDYDFYDGTLKSGRLQFDTGLLYRKERLFLHDAKCLLVERGNHHLKLANRVDFVTTTSARPLHVFVSHWPSRLWCAHNGADRQLLGMRLRDAIEELNKMYGAVANVILLGDYNGSCQVE